MENMHESGRIIMGLPLEIFIFYASGVFYALCAIFILKTVLREKSELINALFAFFVYQAIAMIAMGIEMQTMNMFYGYVGALAVMLGAAYMLKFPFSSFRQGTRRTVFFLSLIAVLAIFVWFLQTPERGMALMKFTLWFDLVVNGIVVGGSIIIFGLMATERGRKLKAVGGGAGVVSCCVASNAAMLSGAILVSSVFQFLAPVLILGSLAVARKNQNGAVNPGTVV